MFAESFLNSPALTAASNLSMTVVMTALLALRNKLGQVLPRLRLLRLHARSGGTSS